jgi:hypothetical protein
MPSRFPPTVLREARLNRDAINYARLETVAASGYSSLMPWHSRDMIAALRARGHAPATIIDATAHIGCDTLLLARVFPGASVVAVEIDETVAAVCRRNCSHSIRVMCGDGAEFVRQNAADLVFVDPPWNDARESLMFGGAPLAEFVRDVRARIPRLLVKVPRETDLPAFQETSGPVTAVYAIHEDRRARASEKLSYYVLEFGH